MANRERGRHLSFWVSDEEYAVIQEKKRVAEIQNMSDYLRKIAIDGYVIRLDIPELRDMLTNLHRSGANLNQLAKRVNETGRFYAADLEDLLQSQARLQAAADNILEKLSFLRSPSMAATPAREPQDESLTQDNP